MKEKTPRSRSHLDFVRSLPCAWCKKQGPSEASHHGLHGTSIKPSDFHAIPLCTGCHRHWHQHGTLDTLVPWDRATKRAWFVEQALAVCCARLAE